MCSRICNNVEGYVKKTDYIWSTRCITPIQTSYCSEIDTSSILQPADATHFQSLIGVLRWIVELGRVDICLGVSMLSSYLASPRIGYLRQALQIFAYLKKHHNAVMVFDPSDPVIDELLFERKDWTSSEF